MRKLMKLNIFLFCFFVLSATVFIQSDCLCATENINKTDPFYINRNSHLYKNVNYNVDKFIKLASNKYGKNYWAYKAITSGNKWSSSIENLKKLLVLDINLRKQEDSDMIFSSLYSRISTILDNLIIDKSLTIDERLKTDVCRQVFAYMNALTVYTTLYMKFKSRHDLLSFKTSDECFEYIYREKLFVADVDGYEKRIMSRLLEIFDNNETQLKKYLFHDWKCYLYQFSVIANGSEHDLAFPYPSTVLSTVINLGLQDNVSKKVECAETFLKCSTVRNLVEDWLNKRIDTKNYFEFIDNLNITETKINFEEIIQKINDYFEVSFFPELISVQEDRYYDYDYRNLLYNFGRLAQIKKTYMPNIRLSDFVLSVGYRLFKKVQKQKLVFHVSSLQDLDVINFFNIFISSYICIRKDISKLMDPYRVGSKAYEVLKVEELLLKLFEYISAKNLNNCHDVAFENIFRTISYVGWNKTLSLLNDAFGQQTNTRGTRWNTKKNDFYEISKCILNEALRIKDNKQ